MSRNAFFWGKHHPVPAVVALVSLGTHQSDRMYSGMNYRQNSFSTPNNMWTSPDPTFTTPNQLSFGGFMAPPAVPFSTPAPSIHSSVFIEEPLITTEQAISSNVALPSASVNMVLPSTLVNFVLTGDSPESDDDVSSLIVSKLMWCAKLWGHDEFQIIINCMLDNGSELVLIRPEIVAGLGLLVRKLKKPISITLALNGSSTLCTFSNFVSLQLSSINNAWSSRPVRALIAPGLCHDILLGLLFLLNEPKMPIAPKAILTIWDLKFALFLPTRRYLPKIWWLCFSTTGTAKMVCRRTSYQTGTNSLCRSSGSS